MGDGNLIGEGALGKARQLVSELEAGNEAEAKRLIDDLAGVREAEMFQELGRLTRELHDALTNFKIDARIADLAEQDIPDAQERLNYVITMTEQAADRVLTAVEDSLPAVEQLQERTRELREQWERFRQRQLSVDEFRMLSKEFDDFFPYVEEGAQKFQSNLSEVLMAQDFQDLTGQIIRRVITLVTDVEESLVHLIRISGKGAEAQRVAARADVVGATEAVGPAVPGVDEKDVLKGQDDVDELLSSLGF